MTSPDSQTPAVLPDEEHIGENVETARPRASAPSEWRSLQGVMQHVDAEAEDDHGGCYHRQGLIATVAKPAAIATP